MHEGVFVAFLYMVAHQSTFPLSLAKFFLK